jgi:L-asparagine transporter-like permease
VRTVLKSYEPVFGGIVAILAAAFLCVLLFTPSPRGSGSSTMHLMSYSGAAIVWGLLQVVGYHSAKRNNVALEEPVLGAPVGCVLLGLILALVTVCLYELAHEARYAIATGVVAAILLCIGAVVGARQGTWK